MNKRMRKRLVLLAAAAVSMTLSGCGSAKKGDAQTKAEAKATAVAEAESSGKEEEESRPSVESQAKRTKAFLSAMTAVLDTTNGASVMETYRALDSGSGVGRITEQAKEMLSESWEINSTEDLYEMADWLMSEGHNRDAIEFLKQYGGTDGISREAFAVKAEEAGAGNRESLMAAYDAWSAYGEAAVAAWDLSRVGTIMGFGYAAGYCTYEEALDKMLEAAVKAQELFDSWDSFNQSYLYGYAYWAEESLEDPDSSAAQRAGIVETLAGQANGPFSVDWGMELAKEW